MALNLKQKLLGAYFLVEEQYYNIVDALENMGRYEFTDYFVNPIEERGIPSFVVALLILLVLLAGAFFLFMRPQPASAGFAIRLYNAYTNEPIDGFVTITSGGEKIAATKTQGARAYYDELPRTQINVAVESEGFEKYEKSVDATKTRFFIARLKPLRGVNAGGIMLPQITEPPSDSELPALPPFEPTPWQPTSEANETPTNESPTPSANASISPTSSPSPSVQASATPTPLNETYVVLAVFNQTEFAGFIVKLVDLGGSAIRINLFNASTNNRILNETIIIVNYSVSYENLEIWFVGTVNDSGVNKARLLLQIFAPVPSPSPTAPPFFFINITSPQENDVIYDAFARVEGFVSVNPSEEITAVEVSIDGGAHWSAVNRTTWSTAIGYWNWNWITPPGGTVNITARARTSSGRNATTGPVRVIVSPCKKFIYNSNSSQQINLVFAPSRYSSAAAFRSAIDNALPELFSKHPFDKSQQKINQINVWYYAYNFNCNHNGRMWECETPQNYIDACGALAQATAVIVNNDTYGGSANPSAHTLAFDSGDLDLFPHEAGHALFGLFDRYCCDGWYPQSPIPQEEKPNLWIDNQGACSTYITTLLGGTPTNCRSISSYANYIGPISAKTLLFQGHIWFEQPADSNMQRVGVLHNFDESDVARINYVLEHGLQSG